MRPLKFTPRHPISDLALSPDGRLLGVCQPGYGFRLFDALTGAELAHDPAPGTVSEVSPTGRYWMYTDRWTVRVAEVAAGRPFVPFQTGWASAGAFDRPPVPHTTTPLHLVMAIQSVRDPNSPGAPELLPPGRPWLTHHLALSDGCLTSDHRFVVGRVVYNRTQFHVCDMATDSVIATNLNLTAVRPGSDPLRAVFTPDESRVVVISPRAVFVFDLPLRVELTDPLAPLPVGRVLPPTVVVPVTQPQPESDVPPFAVLPCGRKSLIRGEKSRIELRDLTTGDVLTVWRWGLPLVSHWRSRPTA